MTSIQFDYSTLSTSISRSELGSIIGRHIVEHNYDINEESSSGRSSQTSEIYVHPSPPDKCKFVYLTFGLLGISTLLPWNFFITANDYWMYKFRDTLNRTCIDPHNKTDLQAAFTSYLSISNNVPYVIFLIVCMFVNNKKFGHLHSISLFGVVLIMQCYTLSIGLFSKMFRIIISLFVMFILFCAITAFVQIDTDNWQSGFFALTLLLVVAVGITSAVLQAGVAGVASLLPAKYVHIMVLGQALAGIIAALAQILSLLGHCDSIRSALIYFFFADIVILFSLLLYVIIQKSEFFKYHVYSLKDTTILKDVSEPEVKTRISVFIIMKLIWPYALTIVLNFWVTIGIFPGLAVLSVPVSPSRLDSKLYLPVCCFLMFNLCDFCGRAVGGWIPFPPTRRILVLVLCSLRVIFIPLLMLCNVHPRYHLPVLLNDDTCYITFIALLGFTNGYFVAVAMMNGIKSVNPLLQEMAGVVLSAFLGAGLMLGAVSSYIFIKII